MLKPLLKLAVFASLIAAAIFQHQAGARGQSRIEIPQGTAERPGLYFPFNDRTGFYAKDSATLGRRSGSLRFPNRWRLGV